MLAPNEWLVLVVKNASPIKRPSWIGNMRASFENGEWNLKTISLFLLTYRSNVMPVKHALLNSVATEAQNRFKCYCRV